MKDPASQCGKSRNLNAAFGCYEERWRSYRKRSDCGKRRYGRRVEPAAVAVLRADSHAATMAAGVGGLNTGIDNTNTCQHLGGKNRYGNPPPHKISLPANCSTSIHPCTTRSTDPAIHLTFAGVPGCDLHHTSINCLVHQRVLYLPGRLSYIKARGKAQRT